MSDRIADIWGTRTAYPRGHIWPNRVDQFLADGLSEVDVDAWVQSACVLCSTGCGCDIAVKDGRMVGVRGRETDVVNHGRLGPKGLYGSWQPFNSPDRLTRPLVRQSGRLVEASWDEAMNRIVTASRERLDREGPGSHGFYTSGQLFLEEYYALGILAKAGIGTPHLDGNTRLCTATAAASLKESFGTDGQPGTYEDLDECEALFCYGHNMAETQTVLWARVLDRMAGPDRPALVCVDPRNTAVARAADVHLRIRPGTNLALMHGLVREVIAQGWVDQDYVAAHTLGFERLADTAAPWAPERVAEVCGVDPGQVREAARIFGTTPRVTSTVLQGFYQAPQATASSCQVNNLHLLRGMLGKPGCGVMQMNGQPTAQNTRECGANGDLAGFRNYANPQHVQELADLWDVDADHIPSGEPPTHAMQIFELAQQGDISLLWISATNPAVSLPQLPRIREILGKPELFLVVQDLFLTETSEFADVVLPAAGWGEKTGTFTNADRVVHLSRQAVEPPGEARSDLAIFLDYASRMGFRTRSGRPLLDWTGPEDGFAAWVECSRGRLCDYTGLSYERLAGGTGIPWPCSPDEPDGTVRLYTDGSFPSGTQECEDYGHDLATGDPLEPNQFAGVDPDGRAMLKTCDFEFDAKISEDFPLLLSTGRTVYHFHTRTKTGRAPQLQAAAPEPWIEISAADAADLGIRDGERCGVHSKHGSVEVQARITDIQPGVVFAPFHYGARTGAEFDQGRAANTDAAPTAANELTQTEIDPTSKQPIYKCAAVRVGAIS
jgi:ferredoxin-nitrate reductase